MQPNASTSLAPLRLSLCRLLLWSALLGPALLGSALLWPTPLWSQGVPATPQAVFPGAIGFGVETPAGTDGQVVRVTNLNNHGPGSLRAAIATPGPRLVVFEVGGIIDLEEEPLRIDEPYLTIAGQTAPAPGITLIKGSLYAHTHDLLIQHLRIRPGDAGHRPATDRFIPHGFRAFIGAHNVIVDHCSLSWAIEETCSASGPAVKPGAHISEKYQQNAGRFTGWPDRPEDLAPKNVTFSHNILAEGLFHSTMSKGPHSHGSLIGDGCQDIAIIGNLYAHNDLRNPYFKRHTSGVIVNNLLYNTNTVAMNIGHDGRWDNAPFEGEPARLGIVGNMLIYGPSTMQIMPVGFHPWGELVRRPLPMISSWTVPPGIPAGSLYLEDNVIIDHDGQHRRQVIAEGDLPNFVMLAEPPTWPAGLKPIPALQLEAELLDAIGARPWDRDPVDQRIIEDVRRRGGRIINSQSEVGGYPVAVPRYRTLHVPDHGRRQWLADFKG